MRNNPGRPSLPAVLAGVALVATALSGCVDVRPGARAAGPGDLCDQRTTSPVIALDEADVPELTAVAPVPADGEATAPRTADPAPQASRLAVEVQRVEALPDAFQDPFDGAAREATGRFFGVQYVLANDSSTTLQAATQVNFGWYLTDGDRSWSVADRTTVHRQGISAAWAEAAGDRQPETLLPPGFRLSTWAVFDVPRDVEPTQLVLQAVEQEHCVPLPLLTAAPDPPGVADAPAPLPQQASESAR